MLDRERRVREIAHRLWEEEGRPADQEKRHWATAERIFDTEARVSSTQSELDLPRDEAGDAGRPDRMDKRRTERKGRRSAVARSREPVGLKH